MASPSFLIQMRKLRAELIQIYYSMQFLKAIIFTFLWGNWRWITPILKNLRTHLNLTKQERQLRKKFCFMWGRYESPEPIRCSECGWAGSIRNLIHTYEGYQLDGDEPDVDPVDKCPRCGVTL